VNGSTTASKNIPTKKHRKTIANKKDHKLLIIGDSHARRWAQKVKAQIKNNILIQGIIKPGAGANILETTAKSDIISQTKNDVVLVCVGANDIAKNNAKIALNHISNFVKLNNHTNIIVTNLPHRFDLPQSSCVNSEISLFNRRLIKNMKLYNHASILELCNERKFFTNHGLHLNGLGKEVMAEKIASHTLTVLNQKKNPPIVVSWSSETAITVTQSERASIIIPIKTKETPENTISANVGNGVSILLKDNTWVDDIGLSVQNGICNMPGENTDDKEAFHQSQLQPSNSQEVIQEVEEMKTQHLKQKKALCKVSSRPKKPVIKSDDFLW
jgi:lysophospholipase L1-like esterase